MGIKRHGSGLLQGDLIEAGIQDVLDPFVRVDAGGQSATRGSFKTLSGAAFGQAQDPEAGTISLLGVSARGQGGLDELPGLGPDLLRPAQEAVGGPLGIVTVVWWHVFQQGAVAPASSGSGVRRHPAVLAEGPGQGGRSPPCALWPE